MKAMVIRRGHAGSVVVVVVLLVLVAVVPVAVVLGAAVLAVAGTSRALAAAPGDPVAAELAGTSVEQPATTEAQTIARGAVDRDHFPNCDVTGPASRNG